MFVTRHTPVVDVVLADKLWDLYETRLSPAWPRNSASREMFFRVEFDEAIADSDQPAVGAVGRRRAGGDGA